MKIAATLAMLGMVALSPLAASDQGVPPDERDTAHRAAKMFKAQRYEEAEGLYRVILQEHPKCVLAWTNLGVTYATENRNKEARDAFAHAVSLAPKNVIAVTNLGRTELALEDYPNAAKHLKAAVALDPRNWPAHDALANALDALGLHDEARSEAHDGNKTRTTDMLRGLEDITPDDLVPDISTSSTN